MADSNSAANSKPLRDYSIPRAPPLPSTVRIRQITPHVTLNIVDTDGDTVKSTTPMTITEVSTTIPVVDAFTAVEHYTLGDRSPDVDHIVVLPLPSTADDADATAGNCTNPVDESRYQCRPSLAYPSHWYCRQCRNAPRCHAQTQTTNQKFDSRRHHVTPNRPPAQFVDHKSLIVAHVSGATLKSATGGEVRMINERVFHLVIAALRYMRWLRVVALLEETSIALLIAPNVLELILVSAPVDWRTKHCVGRVENALYTICASVAKDNVSPFSLTSAADKATSDEFWLEYGDLKVKKSCEKVNPFHLNLPTVAEGDGVDDEHDCRTIVSNYTKEEQVENAQQRLQSGPLISLIESSSDQSVCISCDVPLCDVASGDDVTMNDADWSTVQQPTQRPFIRPSTTLFPEITVTETDIVNNASAVLVVVNAFEYFTVCHPSDNALAETAVCLAINEDTVQLCREKYDTKKPKIV